MSAAPLPSAIADYLLAQHVLTLATQGADGLWCASCFYVFDAARQCCYLMTADDSRHTRAMAANPQVAGTIADQTESVAHIQGIQFTALAQRVPPEQLVAVRECYCQRFPVARLKSAPLWCLQLQSLKMTDNRLGFGKKLHWQRGDD